MATITTDTFLDGGTARTAGETWAINGATLIIRTDTRWHANAPASMTGSLGTMTCSAGLGGSIKIDATKVRWMPYDSGSGNVPAIGTSVSQGETSGYLLGVWANLQSAPTAVGAAMPSSGFIKFREVYGSFTAGSLTGIGASATGPDVTGWIEVCVDASANFVTNILGGGLITEGGWFELGTTNGSRGQTFDTPTNGGGTNSYVFGVQIETAPGSNEYEWYPTAHQTLGAATWSTANYTTDARAKIVESLANGVVRIGSNGSVDIGYCPPSGCKVRIPNILGRTVATASRAVNQTPGAVTRSGINGGNYNIQHMHADFQFQTINATPKFILKDSAFESRIQCQDNIQPIIIDGICVGGFTGGAVSALNLTRCNIGAINNSKFVVSGFINGTLRVIESKDVSISNTHCIIFKSRTAVLRNLSITSSFNITVNDFKSYGAEIYLTNTNNFTVNGVDHIDRLEGNTTTANPITCILISACNDGIISNITFGENGLINNTNCYNAIINSSGNCSNIKIRNIGVRTSPINCGDNSSLYPNTIFSPASSDSNIKVQRCYVSGCRSGIFGVFANPINDLFFEDMYVVDQPGTNAPPNVNNGVFRKVGGSMSNILPSNSSGIHWYDGFTSDTVGNIRWYAVTPSNLTADKNYLVVTPAQGTGYISTSSTLSLDSNGDYAISESPHIFLGHTGFQNVNPTISGASIGLTVYYDLDTGSGFSETWKLATGANLSAETISPSGFKMKIKITSTGASKDTALGFINFPTTSTLQAQAENQYPLDTVRLSFEGLQPGSEIRAYVGTNPETSVEIGGVESVSGDTWYFDHSSSGQEGYIMIFALGYQPIKIPRTYSYENSTLLIQQVIDRNYSNPS